LRIFSIPDITTDGSYTLGGVITAIGLSIGLSPFLVLLLAISGGALAGFTTGIIHTRLKVNALLSGIIVMTGLYSINLKILGRSNLPLDDKNTLFNFLPIQNSSLQQASVLILVIVILIILINLLLKTDFGIAMRATGNSEPMVLAMGINADRMKVIGLSLANACTALSGFLIVQFQGYADINMGIGIVISGLGSVMIGEAIVMRLKHKSILLNIIAVVVGCILFRLILGAALSLGLDPNYLRLITAGIVLLFVATGNYKMIVRS
jgi:putative ABC transport system permease protein